MHKNTDTFTNKEAELLLIVKRVLKSHSCQFYDITEMNSDITQPSLSMPRRYGYRNLIDKGEIHKLLDVEFLKSDTLIRSSMIVCLLDLFSKIFQGLKIKTRVRINHSDIFDSINHRGLLDEISKKNIVTANMIKQYLGLHSMLAIVSQEAIKLYKAFPNATLRIKQLLEETSSYLPDHLKDRIDIDILLGILSGVSGFSLEFSAFFNGKYEIIASGQESGNSENKDLIMSISIDTLLSILDEMQAQEREDLKATLIIALSYSAYKVAFQKASELIKRGYPIILTLEEYRSKYYEEHFKNIVRVYEDFNDNGLIKSIEEKGENIFGVRI